MQQECLFCKIIAGKIPSQKILETETVFAFRDISPQAKEHILVIPKKHVESLAHVQEEIGNLNIISELYSSALTITEQLGILKKGFRTVINTGVQGGQTVFHLHLHILGGEPLGGKFG